MRPSLSIFQSYSEVTSDKWAEMNRSVRFIRHHPSSRDHVRKYSLESARHLRDRRHRGRSSQAKIPLLHICDLYDTALCLRVLWILHHSHVQFFLAFAECDVCCAITRSDLKYVQKLAVRRYLQNLTAEPLSNINVTLAVDLHAIRSNPPGFDLVSCEKVEQSKVRPITQRAILIDLEFQYAVSDGFADVEGLLIWRDPYSVGVIEIVRYLDPFLAARRKVENFSHHGGWHILVRAEHCGISAAIGGHHNVIYAAVEWLAVFVGIPTTQLLAGHIEFKDGAMLLGAREEERPLFRERQPVMAATRSMIQHGGRFAIPFRERVRNPANVVKVTLNVQRPLGSKNVADD